jgi:hypothetical protein
LIIPDEVIVITGFNTDIEHDGTIYHVQTEDKGLENPFILSLVYVGGAILASKRAPYTDLVATGFDQSILGERVQRQHKLICAAISAGRIDELRRMSQRDPGGQAQTVNAPGTTVVELPPDDAERASAKETPGPMEGTPRPAAGKKTPRTGSPSTTAREAPPNGNAAVRGFESIPAEIEDELHLSLLEEKDFRAGDIVTLRLVVTRGAYGERQLVAGASVTVKVLGTEFRPLILTSKTDADGVAMVHAWLPRFTKGRAAILLRATADGCSAELRRVIHHN